MDGVAQCESVLQQNQAEDSVICFQRAEWLEP